MKYTVYFECNNPQETLERIEEHDTTANPTMLVSKRIPNSPVGMITTQELITTLRDEDVCIVFFNGEKTRATVPLLKVLFGGQSLFRGAYRIYEISPSNIELIDERDKLPPSKEEEEPPSQLKQKMLDDWTF